MGKYESNWKSSSNRDEHSTKLFENHHPESVHFRIPTTYQCHEIRPAYFLERVVFGRGHLVTHHLVTYMDPIGNSWMIPFNVKHDSDMYPDLPPFLRPFIGGFNDMHFFHGSARNGPSSTSTKARLPWFTSSTFCKADWSAESMSWTRHFWIGTCPEKNGLITVVGDCMAFGG